MKDFFPSDVMRPNPECSNAHCRRQQAAPEHANWTPMVWQALGHDGSLNLTVEHSDNEWGIELSADDNETESSTVVVATSTSTTQLASGLQFAYQANSAATAAEVMTEAATEEVSLEQLMGQLKSL